MLLGVPAVLQAQPTATPPASDPAATATPRPAPAPVPGGTLQDSEDADTIVLSPFEVVADTRGYYSSNTMSGTRFNTKIEDLASSITIMSKEQMADLAMTDINDVFLYVAGTEGTGTYTDYSLDRNGSISDNVQINPAQANRVRGIAPANVSLGNIETMGRVPLDPIGIDSIEISRGPNANVFGLGNPSGTVNQVPSSANLQRNRSQVGLRVDSYGGYRESFDHNQVLMKDKLAVRFQQVFQHEGFEREPSGLDTERYHGFIKFKPFENTTLSAAYLYYHAYGNRPNSLPPRDNISYWLRNGSPTWDPVARVIHVNGLTSNPITATTFPTTATFVGATGPQNIDYFTASWLGFDSSQLFIERDGSIGYWASPNTWSGNHPWPSTAATAPAWPVSAVQSWRYVQITGAADARGTGVRSNTQPLFLTTPTVKDKSIYDWENINISAVNRIWDRSETLNLQLDQIFVHDEFQTLAFQANFFREDSDRWTRNYIGIANDLGQSGQLSIDVNERLLDGTPNPYFLRPYIGAARPRTVLSPAKWDTTRGQVAYRIDLTQKDGWLKNLGTHQLTGYYEYKYRVDRRYSWREAITSDHAWLPDGIARGNQTNGVTGQYPAIQMTRNYFRYYVGDNSGNDVDYAPSDFKNGTYEYVWGQGGPTGTFNREQATLGLVAASDATGGNNNSKVTIKTVGGVVQSQFLKGLLVTTVGVREDEVYTNYGDTRVFVNPDGVTLDYESANRWSTTRYFDSGRTTNYQAIIRPLRDAGFVGESGFLAELARGLSLGYNKSDSFLPSTPAQDLYRNLLPNPTGEDESYTLGLNLFGGDLVIRATRYENTQKDARNNDASVFNQRVSRIDISPRGQTANPARLLFQADAWVRWENPTWSDEQVRDRVTELTKIDEEQEAFLFEPGVPFASTADLVAKGTEIEINYNPKAMDWWTVSGSITESKVTNRNVSATLQQWIDERMPVWTSLVDPRIGSTATGGLTATPGNTGNLWWKQLYASASGNQTPEDNFIAFVGAPYSAFRELEGKANTQSRKYKARFSTKVNLSGITDNDLLKRFEIGGAVRYESKAVIGYYGVQEYPEKITQLDVNRPIHDDPIYGLDLFVTYKTKLWNDKVNARIQFNVRNLNESGELRPVGVFPNGEVHTYRIVDPRQFILQATFDL